ncbi:DUF2147 domain-containing protein [Puia dinghuensis]|uniref:DUF2147 domain-containing protein n=1 Tax=Puia dinghuensis TaxID=1792502 RepID=A0A8J2UGQ4_9BACT|nr:DUF2147 domain-containing protein [Puia dinghuensis]GGB15566.1 hypothetical protein GCM10011511_44220 [Puia dinghuensis]
MSWPTFFRSLLDVADKYYIIAGIAFLVFYVLLRKRITWKKIQTKFPARKDYVREIVFSTISIVIFALPPLLLVENDSLRPHTTYYADVSRYGWGYFFAAFPLMLVIHDAYFYWMHRLIHHPRLFKLFHLVHHRSVNPSPWAAYAFHPLEAVLESLIFVIFLFTLPINGWHLFAFFVISLVYNVYGHLGFELYPASFSRNWLGKWINTSVSHNLHHRYFKGNYGLYFLFWDRMMGTLRKDYDESFAEATEPLERRLRTGPSEREGPDRGGTWRSSSDEGRSEGPELRRSSGRKAGVAGTGEARETSVVGQAARSGSVERQGWMGLLLVVGVVATGPVKPDDVTGVWMTHGDRPAKIQIYRSGDQYFGKIVYLQFPNEDNGKPRVDKNNPDERLRSRPLLGLGLLSGFKFDEDEWNGGKIYDPQSGKTYSCTMSLKDMNTLKVRGYVGISLLGRTEVWTRTVGP